MKGFSVICFLILGVASIQGDGSCTPDTVWTKNCQDCKCLASGVPSCTPVPNCVPKDEVVKEGCTLGEVWKEDCNTCRCIDDGKKACTRRLCPSDPHYEINLPSQANERRKRDTRPQDCTPGQVWKESCRDCHCTDDKKVACTRQLCEDEQDRVLPGFGPNRRKREETQETQACKPGDVWKEKCNDCHCTDNGLVACTRKLCEGLHSLIIKPTEPSRRKRDAGKTCTPNTTWDEDCNKCHCREDGTPSCTEKKCKEELVVKDNRYKQNCEPGDKWKDTDCNVCRCGGDRIAVCTKRLCPGKGTRPLAALKSSTPPTNI